MTAKNESIDFIPDEVLNSRQEDLQYNLLLKVGIVLFVISLILGGSLFVYQLMLEKDVKSITDEVNAQLREIDKMKNVAESGYTLGVRLSLLDETLKSRVLYSTFMKEISKRTPSNITFADIVLNTTGQLSLTGTSKSSDYTPIADLKDSFSKSDLFSNVKVISAQGDSEGITFSITLDVDVEKLKEGNEEKLNNEVNVFESSMEGNLN